MARMTFDHIKDIFFFCISQRILESFCNNVDPDTMNAKVRLSSS